MKKTILLIFALVQIGVVWAHSISVNNVSLENFNESEGWVQIKCDIVWHGSWRIDSGPSNWDAAWVFVKYRANGGAWSHATLSAVNTEFQVPTDSYTIDVSNDSKGAFLYRSNATSGSSVTFPLLGWDLNADGIDINDTIEVKVFAIEMVYVPEGSFFIGTGIVDPNIVAKNFFYNQQISSEDEITVTYQIDDIDAGDGIGLLPADYPKGYNAFYCMKYEISEEQYIEWFNTLNLNQQSQTSNDITSTLLKNSDEEVDGNTVSWLGIGTEATTSAPDRACNYIGKVIFAKYLRWAGLRPMTELEYEKAARGPGFPEPDVYAWGDNLISTTAYTISSPGFPTEQIAVLPAVNEGRATYSATSTNFSRPLRCGIFSTANGFTNGTRENAGASYYGIMELSGNVAERVVSVGESSDRAFTTAFSIGVGINGLRGGGWIDDASLLLITDRTYGGGTVGGSNSNSENVGGRGVRTAD